MKKRMKHRSLRAGSLLVSCLFLALAVGWICADTLFGASLFGGLTGRGRDTVTVTVPELTGQPYSAALPDAPTLPADPRGRSGESGQSAPSGLSPGLSSGLFDISVTYVYSREPARQILEQSPPPGARRKVIPGQRRVALHLTVSMGQPVHPVPDTVGLSRIAAEKALRDRGLSADIRESAPPSARRSDAGCVLRSVPPAGTRLEEGDSVILYVAPDAPASSVRCPSLVGLDLASARDALSRAGLSAGQVLFLPSPDLLPGTVLSQSLAPSSLLPPGTPVARSVSVPLPQETGDWRKEGEGGEQGEGGERGERGSSGGLLKESPEPPRTFPDYDGVEPWVSPGP